MKDIKIRVKVEGGRGYDIIVGNNNLENINKVLGKLELGDSVFIITSPRIGGYHLDTLLKGLNKVGYKDIHVVKIPDGEKYKSFASYDKLLKEISNYDFGSNKDRERKIFVVNLGGGVIGDLGGYLASTYKRGIDYIQVPTTLLAFVDCGIGGKVGINFNNIKNIIGQFHQPKIVFGDLSVLNTLSKRELKSGIAEVIKYGVITSPTLFEYIEDNIEKLLNLDENVLHNIVTECYTIKASIVARDERDTKGIRATLNYGHTIGHAIEAASKYAYRHGEAISIGMVCANDIAVELGLMKKDVAARIEKLFMKIGLPIEIKKTEFDEIIKYFWFDKKFVEGRNRFILALEIGKTVIQENVSMKIVNEVIKKRFAK